MRKESEKEWIYVYVELNRFALHLKQTILKSPTLQFKTKRDPGPLQPVVLWVPSSKASTGLLKPQASLRDLPTSWPLYQPPALPSRQLWKPRIGFCFSVVDRSLCSLRVTSCPGHHLLPKGSEVRHEGGSIANADPASLYLHFLLSSSPAFAPSGLPSSTSMTFMSNRPGIQTTKGTPLTSTLFTVAPNPVSCEDGTACGSQHPRNRLAVHAQGRWTHRGFQLPVEL